MHKTYVFLSSFLLLIILCSFQSDGEQSCQSYFPLMKGNRTELTISKANGEVKGKILYEIANFELLNLRNKSTVSTIYFNEKDQPFYVGEVNAVCYKDNTDLDMIALLPFDIIKLYANQRFVNTTDKVDLPINAFPLKKLRDGNINIEVFGKEKKLNDINLNLFNRQVDNIENVITTVGEFKCIKTSYTLKTNMAISKFSKVVEWYSREIGLVKFERYNKKGVLIESGILTGVEK